jgi:hypothetical protein
MADPKRKVILDNVESELEKIETTSGYNYTVAAVTRRIKQYSEVRSFPHINIFSGPGKKAWNTNTDIREEMQIGVQIIYKRQNTPADLDALADDCEKLIQDVDNAMLADITRGHPEYVEMTSPVLVDPYVIWQEHIAIIDMVYSVAYWYVKGAA